MIAFSYLCILLFIIIFILYLIYLSNKRCPKKIKKFYLISLFLLLARYISVVLLWVLEKQSIVYFIKSLTQINIICIPLLILVALYVFLRDEKRTFDYNYMFMAVLFLIYIVLISIYKLDIKIDSVFGFVVFFKNIITPSLVYLIILSSLTVVTLLFIDKPYSNYSGMKLLMTTLVVVIGEFIVFLGGIKIFPYPIIGEVLILCCSYKAINTFK